MHAGPAHTRSNPLAGVPGYTKLKELGTGAFGSVFLYRRITAHGEEEVKEGGARGRARGAARRERHVCGEASTQVHHYPLLPGQSAPRQTGVRRPAICYQPPASGKQGQLGWRPDPAVPLPLLPLGGGVRARVCALGGGGKAHGTTTMRRRPVLPRTRAHALTPTHAHTRSHTNARAPRPWHVRRLR